MPTPTPLPSSPPELEDDEYDDDEEEDLGFYDEPEREKVKRQEPVDHSLRVQ